MSSVFKDMLSSDLLYYCLQLPYAFANLHLKKYDASYPSTKHLCAQ